MTAIGEVRAVVERSAQRQQTVLQTQTESKDRLILKMLFLVDLPVATRALQASRSSH